MSGKQESCNKTASVTKKVPTRDLQNELRIIKIKGDRTINFVVSNATDKNVINITYNNEPKCDIVNKMQDLKLDLKLD